jgi:hypothetical protein
VGSIYKLLEFAGSLTKKKTAPLKLSGILFTQCQDIQDVERYFVNDEIRDFKTAICPVTIPSSPLATDSGLGNKPACLIDIKSDYAEAFLDLSYEFLYRERKNT